MVRSGTDSPPFTSPVAVSPTMGAFENSPGRDPLGSGPRSLSAGFKPAMAMSTLALPGALTGPGVALGGGAKPLDKTGAPSPSGKGFFAADAPTMEASGIGTSAV